MGARKYISDFIKRGGISVFISTGFVKLSAAILAIVVVRLMTKENYGILAYALSIYGVGIVISGVGGQYSLLRFGSLLSSQLQKKEYYNLTMISGVKNSAVLSVIVILFAFLPIHPPGSFWYIVMVGISLISFFVIELQRSYFRILNLNRVYSRVNEVYSITLLMAVVFATWLFGGYGYIAAYVFIPVIVFLVYNRDHITFNSEQKLSKDYWIYGIHTSLSSVANQIIFSVAPFLLGVLEAPESDIADFKVATIIPFNLLTLPGILMITDFNFLSKNYLDGERLIDYYKSYIKVIIPVTTVIFIPLIVWGESVIHFLFGEAYIGCYDYYVLFMIATYITFFFRNPLGNILLAVGKASWNGYNAYFFGALYILFTLLAYNYLGTNAAVYGLCGTFVLSGFLSLILFKKYLNKIKQ